MIHPSPPFLQKFPSPHQSISLHILITFMEPNINAITQLNHNPIKEKMKKSDSVTESEDDLDELLARGGKRAATGGSSTKKGSSGAGATSMKSCQAEKCSADLTDAKTYHRRHKVCEHHAKAQVVLVAGIRQRFCQQCSRFHELSEFDEVKRSCRRRLAGHNERRRKSSTDNNSQAEGSNSSSQNIKESGQLKDIVCGQIVQENASYRHFHVR